LVDLCSNIESLLDDDWRNRQPVTGERANETRSSAADQTVVTAPTEPTETSITVELQARREMAAADQAIKR